MCGRLKFLMFLLFAANAHKYFWVQAVDDNEVIKHLDRIEMDQLMQVLNIKSLISRILQANDRTAAGIEKLELSRKQSDDRIQEISKEMSSASGKLEKIDNIEKKIDFMQKQVQEIVITTTHISDCPKLSQWADFNKTNLFSAVDRHFYFNRTAVTWFKARDWCVERGMQLATLKNASQVEAVTKELRKRGQTWSNFWLSANDIGQTPGHFLWSDGSMVDNTTWYSGKPDDFGAGKQTCVYFNTYYAKLYDEPCSNKWYFMCEIPAALSSCLQ